MKMNFPFALGLHFI